MFGVALLAIVTPNSQMVFIKLLVVPPPLPPPWVLPWKLLPILHNYYCRGDVFLSFYNAMPCIFVRSAKVGGAAYYLEEEEV